jgi:AraC-like DNA-binding protein
LSLVDVEGMDRQLVSYLDRLGEPFLFLEERMVRVAPEQKVLVTNSLPKIVFVLEGELEVSFERGGTYSLKPGSVLVNLRPLDQLYFSRHEKPPSALRVLRLTLPWGEVEKRTIKHDFTRFLHNQLPPVGVFTPEASIPWSEHLYEARIQLSSRQSNRRPRTNAALRMALIELAQIWQSSTTSTPDESTSTRRLQNKIESFIEDHLEEPFRLRDVARAVDRSEEHVSRFFKQQRGLSLFDEILRLRLERARYFLLCTDLKVTVIAEKCGFSSLAHFSRRFSQVYKLSPREFREKR